MAKARNGPTPASMIISLIIQIPWLIWMVHIASSAFTKSCPNTHKRVGKKETLHPNKQTNKGTLISVKMILPQPFQRCTNTLHRHKSLTNIGGDVYIHTAPSLLQIKAGKYHTYKLEYNTHKEWWLYELMHMIYKLKLLFWSAT